MTTNEKENFAAKQNAATVAFVGLEVEFGQSAIRN
jgi:hypothetical protein